MNSSTTAPERLPPIRTALLIIGVTIASVLVFRFTLRGGPAPSVDDIPPPLPLQADTQQEIVIDPGTFPADALANITLIPARSHPFLRSIGYALIHEFRSTPGVRGVQLLPDLPTGAPIPPGLQLTLDIIDLNESQTIEPRSLVSVLRITAHIPDYTNVLPALEIHQRADIHGAETPTIWYREAAAAIAPGIVSNIVQATTP